MGHGSWVMGHGSLVILKSTPALLPPNPQPKRPYFSNRTAYHCKYCPGPTSSSQEVSSKYLACWSTEVNFCNSRGKSFCCCTKICLSFSSNSSAVRNCSVWLGSRTTNASCLYINGSGIGWFFLLGIVVASDDLLLVLEAEKVSNNCRLLTLPLAPDLIILYLTEIDYGSFCLPDI